MSASQKLETEIICLTAELAFEKQKLVYEELSEALLTFGELLS
jgi:hypothetical protein